MKSSVNEKFYTITVIGGGLTGQLMVSLLLKSNNIDTNKLCWINLNKKRFIDTRVSFLNTNNFFKLKHKFKYHFNESDYLNIKKIQIHNEDEKLPLSLEDNQGHGVIIKNNTLKKSFKFLKKNLKIFNSKVIKTKIDQYHRYLYLEDGTKIKTSLVISADGNSSALRDFAKIKYISHNLNHTIISGYLYSKKFNNSIAKQVFLNDGFIGLLPISKNNNLVNFVWSLDNEVLKNNKSNFKYHDEIIQRLNSFFTKYNICFENQKAKTTNYDKLQIYSSNVKFVNNPFSEKIALIGDAAHTIHPLAGQGFNLSIEDCFDLLKCIDKASSYGKDLGDISILNEYGDLRKKRTNLITLITTSIFYLFKKRTRKFNNIINLVSQNLNKIYGKKIFSIIARGY